MSFEAEDFLFSDGSFELPLPWDKDTPHYNPQVGVIYSPRFEKEKLDKVVFGHEYFHRLYSSRPSICFQRLLSRLIYYEFTRDKFSKSSTISSLFPSKNPIIRMLGDIFYEIHSSNAFVQEALVLQRQYQHPRKLKEAGFKPEEWLEKGIKEPDIDLPEFESTCKTFCKSEFMEHIRPIIEYLSLAPPQFFPDVPTNKEGGLDSSRIDPETADRVIKQFQSRYHSLPYSPWKRFYAFVSIAKQMENDKQKPTKGYFLQKVKNDERLEIDLVTRKEANSNNVCPNKNKFCPVDTFYSEGLKIPFVDYGSPKRNFSGERFGKMLQCRVRDQPFEIRDEPFFDKDSQKSEEILHRQTTNEMSKVLKKVHLEEHQDKPLIQFTGCGLLRRGYQSNWPFSAFLMGSELLRLIIFANKQIANRSKNIKLIDYFIDQAVETESNCLKPSHPIPAEDSFDFPKLDSVKRLSPFLTAEARVTNHDYTLALID